jgi:hypothetical protein
MQSLSLRTPSQGSCKSIENFHKAVGDETESLYGRMHLVVPVLLVVPARGESLSQVYIWTWENSGMAATP